MKAGHFGIWIYEKKIAAGWEENWKREQETPSFI